MARPQTTKEWWPGFRRILLHFRPYLRKHPALIAGSFMALLAETLLRLLEPWPLKFVFDRVLVTAPGGGLSGIPAIDRLHPMSLLTLSALAVVAITGLRALAAYGNTVGFALIGNRVLTEIRNKLYRHLQCLSLSFHAKARSGDLTLRVISDVGLLQEVIVTAVLPLLASLLILVGMLGVMFWLQWELALLAVATIPLFWLFTVRLSRRIHEVAHRQRQREGAMAATAAESIGAIKSVQALSLEGIFGRAFSSQNSKSLKEGVIGKRLEARLERIVDVLIAIAMALVLWYGTKLALRNLISPGDLLVFLAYLKNAFKPLQDFAKYTGRLAKATAAGERVLDVLERVPEVRDLPTATRAPVFRGAVRFEGVSFAYEPGRPVLKEINLGIEGGQHVALVGPSGSGKSTLVSLMLRLYDPLEGRVMIDGGDVRSFSLESLRSQISVVLQDSLLFAASVSENIAFGAPDATAEAIEAAARLANAHQFIEAMPEGYDAVLGERGVTLSNGQRQRIAIARAAIRKAPILILDEPTIGLDEENERAVIEALERLSQGRTTLLITHNLGVAARADLIFYLDGGVVRERGRHTELMKANGMYATLYRLQAGSPGKEEFHALSR